MQSRVLKIVGALLILIQISVSTLEAQISGYRLQQADSLFLDKKYTQSLEHYQTILAQNQYSPAMLLKMAYIQEGLNRVGQALYYLNLYYIATNDKSVLQKMDELATRYNLDGYQLSDADQAMSFYRDYHLQITIALAVIALFFVALAFSVKRKGQRPIASAVVTLIILLILFYHVNIGGDASMGIIGNAHTFLMNGPSPGASVVEIVEEGHRVEIIGKKDVWMEVLWQGEVAYVREGNLLPVVL
jgi:Lipopolysaccharide export system permease LptF/LptG